MQTKNTCKKFVDIGNVCRSHRGGNKTTGLNDSNVYNNKSVTELEKIHVYVLLVWSMVQP